MVASSTGRSIVVLGSTGQQGGSVISALIESEQAYQIYAVTRDASKPASQKLKSKGCELVEADMSDKDSLVQAFKGKEIVWAFTDFWGAAKMDKEKEISDGKKIVDAAKSAGVKLFLWSGLENVSKVTGGENTGVEHFDGKAEITEYAQSQLPTIVVEPGCYIQNFTGMMGPKKQEDGSVKWFLPIKDSTVFSLLDVVADYGKYVRAALENSELGSEVLACPQEITLKEMMQQFNQVTGIDSSFVQVRAEGFAQSGGKATQELYDMLHFFEQFGYYGGKDISKSNKFVSGTTTWKQFVEKQDWKHVQA